jgi:hypothetical protein
MGYRPGEIKNSWVGVPSTAGAATPVLWSHSFYPETLRTNATLQDKAQSNLILINQAYCAAPGLGEDELGGGILGFNEDEVYYICQGMFHPNYAGTAIRLNVSFDVITANVTTVDFEGSLRVWNEGTAIDQAHSYTQYNKSVIVSATDRVYNAQWDIAAVGNLVANNLWQCKVVLHDMNDADEVSVTAIKVMYAIDKNYA